MTKGQRAMAVAKIYPDPEKGGRGKKGSVPNRSKIDKGRLSEARTVLRYAPDLADNVLSGAESLDAAYKTAIVQHAELFAGPWRCFRRSRRN